MVVPLKPPRRPLPSGGKSWDWRPRAGTGRWRWCRVYHLGSHTPDGHTPRSFGPLARFDPHRPAVNGDPQFDPDGRSVLYVGADLATSLSEVFGEPGEAQLCPRWRVAVLTPTKSLAMFDLAAEGSAMEIGALPTLADGALPRALTQEWARAIYDDRPAVRGIRYRSAYNGGLALAVWNGDRTVTTAVDSGGNPADLALAGSAMIDRVTIACQTRRIDVSLINTAECARCRVDP